MIARQVQVIYCDDIRQEVNGKLSFIGVYANDMLVNKFPIVVSKLCVSVKTLAPASDPINSMTVRILKDDELLQEIVVGEDQIAASLQKPEEELAIQDEENRVQLTQFLLTFSPLQFVEPCKIKVRVQTDKDELRGLALKVGLMPPSPEPS